MAGSGSIGAVLRSIKLALIPARYFSGSPRQSGDGAGLYRQGRVEKGHAAEVAHSASYGRHRPPAQDIGIPAPGGLQDRFSPELFEQYNWAEEPLVAMLTEISELCN